LKKNRRNQGKIGKIGETFRKKQEKSIKNRLIYPFGFTLVKYPIGGDTCYGVTQPKTEK